MNKRECGTCTKCCEGWLHAEIKGQKIYPGKPCFFVEIGKGCKDYENRPDIPCKSFECGWLVIEEMPDEFKPENCGIICNLNFNNGNPYMVISKAPNNPTGQFLSWAIVYARSKNLNILWYIDDKSWWIGNPDFCNQMAIKHPNIKLD